MLCTTHKSCKSQFYIDDKIMSSHSSALFSIINTADEPINSNTRRINYTAELLKDAAVYNE